MANDTLNKIFRGVAFHNLGVAPIVNCAHDVNKILESLPSDEARRMRRKFRKLWRKCAKHPPPGMTQSFSVKHMGLGASAPTRKQKIMRKQEVLRNIDAKYVQPLVKEAQLTKKGTP